MGFIAIEKPSQYGIRPGLPYPAEPSKNVYGLSMFHQLHCLVSLPLSLIVSRLIEGACHIRIDRGKY